jgi:hypothetical protein
MHEVYETGKEAIKDRHNKSASERSLAGSRVFANASLIEKREGYNQ